MLPCPHIGVHTTSQPPPPPPDNPLCSESPLNPLPRLNPRLFNFWSGGDFQQFSSNFREPPGMCCYIVWRPCVGFPVVFVLLRCLTSGYRQSQLL